MATEYRLQQQAPLPPPPLPPYGGPPTEWRTELCHCDNNREHYALCCRTFWCPSITFGQIAEIVDEGTPSCLVSGLVYGALLYFTGCGFCYSCLYRTKMRSKFNLAEKPCGDCLVHCCCHACARNTENSR